MAQTITEFDMTDVYNKEVFHKVEELKLLCNKYKIPMFVSLCVKNDKKESVYVSDMVGTNSNDIHLKNDKIPKYVNVLNGFNTVPPSMEVEIDF